MRESVQSMSTADLTRLAATALGSPLLHCGTTTEAILNLCRHSAAASRLHNTCQPDFHDLGPAISCMYSPDGSKIAWLSSEGLMGPWKLNVQELTTRTAVASIVQCRSQPGMAWLGCSTRIRVAYRKQRLAMCSTYLIEASGMSCCSSVDVPVPTGAVHAPAVQLVVRLSPGGACLSANVVESSGNLYQRRQGSAYLTQRCLSFIGLPDGCPTLEPLVVLEASDHLDSYKQEAWETPVWNALGNLAAVSCAGERKICTFDVDSGMQTAVFCQRVARASAMSGSVLQIGGGENGMGGTLGHYPPPHKFCRLPGSSVTSLASRMCAWSACGKKRLEWRERNFPVTTSFQLVNDLGSGVLWSKVVAGHVLAFTAWSNDGMFIARLGRVLEIWNAATGHELLSCQLPDAIMQAWDALIHRRTGQRTQRVQIISWAADLRSLAIHLEDQLYVCIMNPA